MLLTACTSMCAAAEGFFGPQIVEYIAIALSLLIGWLKLRKVQAEAKAGIDAAHAQVKAAKTEAREARVSLARLEGSLRPIAVSSIAPTLPAEKQPVGSSEPSDLEGTTSASGNYHKVQWPELSTDTPKPTPAELADPKLPRPSAVPREGTTFADLEDTRPETPTTKKRQ